MIKRLTCRVPSQSQGNLFRIQKKAELCKTLESTQKLIILKRSKKAQQNVKVHLINLNHVRVDPHQKL